MRLHVEPTVDDAVRRAADIFVQAAGAMNCAPTTQCTIALPTGRTMIPLYAELAKRKATGQLDLSGARTFNLDELLLPLPHPASFSSYMELHAWHPLGIRHHDIPRNTEDSAAECRRYDAAIAAAGGIDLALLGLGEDGHVAYNLPGPPREDTHIVTLPGLRPQRAITMGLGPIRQARHVLMLATTADKRAAISALLDGPEDPLWPCSLLRGHANFDLVTTVEVMSP